ncbi:hypothetical protein GJ744_005524 [Endocarpon pusillum]|uniref:Uncharacterized protein n=1 Tax=Endocarpon pusillum TaxID=364733 RepID=A0A8H7AKZ1_9EURO|nr:hypothetical protein GJ744_005524 [Endocarpon pusillum]
MPEKETPRAAQVSVGSPFPFASQSPNWPGYDQDRSIPERNPELEDTTPLQSMK